MAPADQSSPQPVGTPPTGPDTDSGMGLPVGGDAFVLMCMSDYRPGRRSDCPDSLHDWPLPDGYIEAHEVARVRLRNGWKSPRCRSCNRTGWIRGDDTGLGDQEVKLCDSPRL